MNDSARPKIARKLTDKQRDLVEANVNLVYHVVYGLINRGKIQRALAEEAISEGMYGLVRAAQWYEPDRGTKFSTLAALTIGQRARYAAAGECRHSMMAPLSLDDISLAGARWDDDEHWVDMLRAEDDTEREALDLLEEQARKILEQSGNPNYARLLLENAKGKPMAELAREEGVSRQAVSKQISRARAILCRSLVAEEWR